jgi:hypothetical protein
MIVPGGGISVDGTRWVPCRPDFILPVEVLSCLFRGRFLAKLVAAHRDGRLKFFGIHARLDNIRAFKAYLAPLRKIEWVVYAKRPFGGPRAVLAYLSRYTHRVAISNRRLLAADDGGVSFRWKDYRIEGPGRWKTMTLTPHEFIRRFLRADVFWRIPMSSNRREFLTTAAAVTGLGTVSLPLAAQGVVDMPTPRASALPDASPVSVL